MTPYERLLREDIPDGSFGGTRSASKPRAKATRQEPTPDPRAAEHYAALEAALDGFVWHDHDARPALRLIPGEAA